MTAIAKQQQVVLVVGGTGFIAAHLLPKLTAAGLVVYATCRGRCPETPGVRWVQGDLSAGGGDEAWPSPCDAVIYLAQGRSWRQFPDGARDMFAINVDGVFRALEYSRRAGVGQFVFASSGSVYPEATGAARESDAIDVRSARSFYAASKLAAELLIGPYATVFTIAVLRLFVPYGRGQAAEMLLPRVVEAIRNGTPVFLQGDSGLQLNPVAVEDVAEAIFRCLTLDRSATMNVAGPDIVTLRELAERIGAQVGRPPRFECQGGSAASIVGDTAALQHHLSWAPVTRLDEGLRRWLTSRQI